MYPKIKQVVAECRALRGQYEAQLDGANSSIAGAVQNKLNYVNQLINIGERLAALEAPAPPAPPAPPAGKK